MVINTGDQCAEVFDWLSALLHEVAGSRKHIQNCTHRMKWEEYCGGKQEIRNWEAFGETLSRGFALYIAKRKNGATFWITG